MVRISIVVSAEDKISNVSPNDVLTTLEGAIHDAVQAATATFLAAGFKKPIPDAGGGTDHTQAGVIIHRMLYKVRERR